MMTTEREALAAVGEFRIAKARPRIESLLNRFRCISSVSNTPPFSSACATSTCILPSSFSSVDMMSFCEGGREEKRRGLS
jgi:hypothetical protein